MEFAPHDIYERYNVDDSLTPEEFANVRTKNGTVGLSFDPYNFRSIIPVLEFSNHQKLMSLNLVPIELGFENPNKEKTFPYIADKNVQQEIVGQLKRLSKEYGTCFNLQNGTIKVDL